MKKIWSRIQEKFATHNVSKHFKIDFLMDGNLEPLHTAYLDGKNKCDVVMKFDNSDLESRRDIVSVNVL